jgi:hypothetical protein
MKLSNRMKIIFNLIKGKNLRSFNLLSNEISENKNKSITNSIINNAVNTKINIQKGKIVLFKKGAFKIKNIDFEDENVYTCAFGDKGEKINNNNYNYKIICFSDKEPIIENVETFFPINWHHDLKKMSLFHKYITPMLDKKNGKKFIWVDSRINVSEEIIQDLFQLLEQHELVLFKHYERSDIYEELKAIFKANRASSFEINKAQNKLMKENFSSEILYETGIIAFKTSTEILNLFTEIYGFCDSIIKRDQIAMPYVLKKNNFKAHIYNNGVTHLRNTNGIEVKKW